MAKEKPSDEGKFRRNALKVLGESRHVMTAGEILMMSEGSSTCIFSVKEASDLLKALIKKGYVSRKLNEYGHSLFKITDEEIDYGLEMFE